MIDLDETLDRATLLAKNEIAWDALWAVINTHDELELTGPRDAAGWSVQDHLAHLAAWERSVVFLLNGLTASDGMGVEEETYHADDIEAINAEIHSHVRDLTLEDVLTDLRAVHEEMIGTIEGLSEATLGEPIDPGGVIGDGLPPTTADKIAWNAFEHFDEHREWIETLLQEEQA